MEQMGAATVVFDPVQYEDEEEDTCLDGGEEVEEEVEEE